MSNKLLDLRHLTSKEYGKIVDKSNEKYDKLVAPHIESYNFFLNDGLALIVKNHKKAYVELPGSQILCIYVKEIFIEPPILPIKFIAKHREIYPKECVERGETYKGQLTALIGWSFDGNEAGSIYKPFGEVPIMVKSDVCHLNKLSRKELTKKGELATEAGGYFIVNGKKRVMRMIVVNRRHYPIALQRDSWTKLESGITKFGVMMRCSSDDESALSNVVHYMKSGHVKLSFSLKDAIVPMILCLQALVDFTDLKILKCLAKGRENDKIFIQRIKMMLSDNVNYDILTQKAAKMCIGSGLRKAVYLLPPNCSDEDVCDIICRDHILPHLLSYEAKFYMLCFMTRKLFSYVSGECIAENVDNTSMQEAWLGGFTCLHFTKSKFESFGKNIAYKVNADLRKHTSGFVVDNEYMKKLLKTNLVFDIGAQFKHMISTGNLVQLHKFGLPQDQGLTVVVEHLNKLRDISHFRAIHRGKFFLEMKSTEPRKFSGEAWGFICPIHTPDGTPCGLLNHLTHDCIVTTNRPNTETIRKTLVAAGMDTIDFPLELCRENEVEIILDGGIVGFVPFADLEMFVQNLKYIRAIGKINKYTEIVNTKQFEYGGQYPALYIFSTSGRLSRPVVNLRINRQEYIGSFEQLYLNIAVSYKDIEKGVHTHYEKSDFSLFSVVGKFVPFLDHNPSPRNIYQCQMAKQTMGTPIHNWQIQTENKLYRLMYPQVPLVRNKHYDEMDMQDFCLGTNAIVAVISYTGYDMEDAMVINKYSLERGFAMGMVYKSEFIDLHLLAKKSSAQSIIFKRDPSKAILAKFLSIDGLPYPNQEVRLHDPYYCIYNETQESYNVIYYKGEDCIIDKVSIMPTSAFSEFRKANITVRIQRNPMIGDKFASRSGQKGIMSRAFPMEDMPFSDRGIIPDIIFNPHGIPSRMTVGMLLEVIAGKAAAEYGLSFDSTPFLFNDENPAYDFYGKILEKAGFDYFGEDTLYSGYDGKAIQCHIFEGIVYYQRLRHMVADKWQVRSLGLINNLTRQPIKGRKKGGAIRFGEMERDCLISHGAAFALQDRMMTCSDATKEYVCGECGNLLSTSPFVGEAAKKVFTPRAYCRSCGKNATVRCVDIPHAFKVLVSELAAVNISVRLGTSGSKELVNDVLN